MARPKLEIDEKMVAQLAGINCSLSEMAAVLDCDAKTLTSRFSSTIEKGRETGKMSLKRKQWELAMSGNVTMLIWLGKIMLDQKDTSRIEVTQLPDVVLANEIERRLKLVSNE